MVPTDMNIMFACPHTIFFIICMLYSQGFDSQKQSHKILSNGVMFYDYQEYVTRITNFLQV